MHIEVLFSEYYSQRNSHQFLNRDSFKKSIRKNDFQKCIENIGNNNHQFNSRYLVLGRLVNWEWFFAARFFKRKLCINVFDTEIHCMRIVQGPI